MGWFQTIGSIIVSAIVGFLIIFFVLKRIGLIDGFLEIFKHKTVSGDAKLNDETQRKLFERKYYKDIAIEEIVYLLNEWTTVLFDTENCFLSKAKKFAKKGQKTEDIIKSQMNEMHSKMLLYCSSRTLSLFALYMQKIYTKGFESNQIENIYMVSLLIANIKFDYSNDFTDPIYILKIKISDIDKIEEKAIELRRKYKEYILA